jgi:hypothetical protein
MRRVRVYLRFFWPSLLLILIAIASWFYLPDSLNNFEVGLVSSALGIGISISVAEGIKKRSEHRRIKKTLGLLKLITVPYLKNQSENFKENLKLYQDMFLLPHVQAFLLLVMNFDKVSSTFDKNWFQMVYSTDFIDAINSDSQLNSIALTISEVLIFTKTLTWQSLNAKRLMAVDVNKFSQGELEHYIGEARKIRDDLNDVTQKLEKYTDKLDDEIVALLFDTGVKYEEFER